jgi:hypothetical protein
VAEKDEKRKSVANYKGRFRVVEKVEWPEAGKEVGILKMTCAELQQARFAAIEHFDKKNVELTVFSAQALDAEEMTQQCFLFLLDPDSKNPEWRIFSSADEARKLLTNDERYYFCGKYNELYEASESE